MNNTLTTLRAALELLEAQWRCSRLWSMEESQDCSETLRTLIASMEAQPEHVKFPQFLTDVVTAAGLLAHGKQDKGLAARISSYAYELRTHPAQPSEPKSESAHDDLTIAYMSGFHDGKKAKAEPVQEPVAWMCPITESLGWRPPVDFTYAWEPLYAAPQARKPLASHLIAELWADDIHGSFLDFARAIEKAHRIEGGAA